MVAAMYDPAFVVIIYIIVYFSAGEKIRTSIAFSLDISAVICYNGYERFFPLFYIQTQGDFKKRRCRL